MWQRSETIKWICNSDVQQSSGQTGLSLRQLLATAQWTTVVVAVQKLLGDGDKWYTMIDNTLQVYHPSHETVFIFFPFSDAEESS